MTYKKINNFAPHEDNGFDIFLGMSGWIFGLFEGIVARLISISGKKESKDDELLHEIEVFTYEMSSGFNVGKNDL